MNHRSAVDNAAVLVSEMPSAHRLASANITRFDTAHPRAAAHPEARPDLRLFLGVNSHGVMGRGRALVVPLRASLVSTHAGIDHHALSVQGEFVAQHVAMRMPKLVIRAERAGVKNETTG